MLKIDGFLREMGGIFAFIGRQYRLEVDEKEYFIDLLLYHRQAKLIKLSIVTWLRLFSQFDKEKEVWIFKHENTV